MKEFLIHGFDKKSLTKEDVKIFQSNNRLKVDGIIGPKTREACWKRKGKRDYTFLLDHKFKTQQENDISFATKNLQTNILDKEKVLKIMYILSSEWDTGFGFLSTQDGYTMGFRRYAGRKLAKMLKHFGIEEFSRVNNGCESETLRKKVLLLSTEHEWWKFQLRLFEKDLAKHLDKHSMKDGRSILLYERARNSSKKWVYNCKSYNDLVISYSKHSRGPSRIREIEKLVEYGEIWR